ncbi:MAG: 6-bladed beta-propeller [Proteobacteria bacterium]|nr:6-bladed beta-propeller [Pseudomonadota bacterium]
MGSFLRAIVPCVLAILLGACAQPMAPKPEAASLVWPAAPEATRIAWVRSFSRPEDLGITPGLFQRFKNLLFGASEVRMVRPMAVAVLGNTVFVADPGAKGVHRFDTGNGDYQLIQADDGSPLPSPVGLAPCGKTLLISDSSRAQLFSFSSGDKGAHALAADVKLQQPTGLACDQATGRIFVSDTAAHQVLRFRLGATGLGLEQSFGRRGAGNGEFNFPTYLWWDGEGRLYVSDALNFRIQMFDAEGRSLGQFGRQGDGSGDAARQKGVATDGRGHVYVVDALFHAFQIFNTGGDFLLAVGARGGDPGEFWLPAGIFIAGDMIYVADSYNSRVQVFRYAGAAP